MPSEISYIVSKPQTVKALSKIALDNKLFHNKTFDMYRVFKKQAEGVKTMYGMEFKVVRLVVAKSGDVPVQCALVWGFLEDGVVKDNHLGVFVNPQYRGQRIGTALVKLASEGLTNVIADHTGTDGNAHKFYSKASDTVKIQESIMSEIMSDPLISENPLLSDQQQFVLFEDWDGHDDNEKYINAAFGLENQRLMAFILKKWDGRPKNGVINQLMYNDLDRECQTILMKKLNSENQSGFWWYFLNNENAIPELKLKYKLLSSAGKKKTQDGWVVSGDEQMQIGDSVKKFDRDISTPQKFQSFKDWLGK